MLKFTIRDLLWLATVVALAFAWWIDRSRVYQSYLVEHGLHLATKVDFKNFNEGAILFDPGGHAARWDGGGQESGRWEWYRYNGPMPELPPGEYMGK